MISDWFLENVNWVNYDMPTIYNALLSLLKFLIFMICAIIDIIWLPVELLFLIMIRR